MIAATCEMITRSPAAAISGQVGDWPPVLETKRSQFTVITPRLKNSPFEVRDLAGRSKLVTPGAGQVMLVNIWATWCAACRPDLRDLLSLARVNIPSLAIIPICADTWDAGEIKGFLAGIGASDLTSYMDPSGTIANDQNPPDTRFPAPKLPITYLIGKSGLTEGYIAGAADWTSKAGLGVLRYYLARS